MNRKKSTLNLKGALRIKKIVDASYIIVSQKYYSTFRENRHINFAFCFHLHKMARRSLLKVLLKIYFIVRRLWQQKVNVYNASGLNFRSLAHLNHGED